jgi:hypothetical protein
VCERVENRASEFLRNIQAGFCVVVVGNEDAYASPWHHISHDREPPTVRGRLHQFAFHGFHVCKFSFACVANAMLAIRVLFEEHATLHVGRELFEQAALIAGELPHRDTR